MANLYELMDEYAQLHQACYGEEHGGPDTETIERLLVQLDESRGELRDKVDAIVAVLRNLGGDVDVLAAEEDRLRKRRTAIENSEKRLREWVRSSMDAMGVDKIKTTRNTVSLSAGRASVVVLDKELVPPAYKSTVVTTTINKNEIAAAFKQTGEIPPGIDIVPGQRVLTIR